MKVLFLTSRFPFPPIGGDKLRFFNILKYLSKNHDVSVVTFSERSIDREIINNYKDYFLDIDVIILPRLHSYINCILGLLQNKPLQISYYCSEKMRKLIQKKIAENKFDIIFVHLIRMAEYVKDYPIYKILDMTDAQSLSYVRAMPYTTGTWSIIHRVEKKFVHQYEQDIWRYFSKTFVVSPIDQQYLKSFNQEMNVEVLPNGVDTEKYQFHLNNHANKRICFIGNMRTFPNKDAVVWFCNEIFPLIKEKIPDIKFYVIGTEPPRKIRNLTKIKDVIVTGEVDNINDYVWNSAVSIAPMRVGAGIQNKILESMALGTPVVSTSIGLEGIEAKAGEHLLVANIPPSFADKVLELINNEELRKQISKNARNLVENKFVWSKILNKLDYVVHRNT